LKRLPRSALPRRLALTVALVAAAALPVRAPLAQVRLPSLGESANEDFTVSIERRLGEQIMRDIRRDPDYLDDPPLLEYLQSIWRPLVAEARERGDITPDTDQQLAWEAFLVRDRSVNAFALPGGYVGVHLGLIAMTTTSDELASVLAHELSHVTQRHIARSIASSQRQSIVSMAALILGVLAASRSNSGDMAQAAIVGSQAAAAQGQLNFSRDMEREADRVGYGVLVGAGFASGGMASMFEKLDAANRMDNNAFPYLRSHPLTTERIAEARARTMQAGGHPMSQSLMHPLMQGRSRVLMDPSVQSLRRQQQPVTGPQALRDRLGLLYAAALASSILREPAVAEARVDEALRLVATARPADPQAEQALRLLKGQLLVDRGEGQAAAQWLDTTPPDARQRAWLLLRAQASLGMHREQAPEAAADVRRSMEALQTWLAEHRQDAAAWGLLAQCAEAAGLKLRALRAQAEEHAALGDLGGAIDRLRAGQALARSGGSTDFIEASVIDARLRDLQAQRRQLAADLRGGRTARDDGQNPPE